MNHRDHINTIKVKIDEFSLLLSEYHSEILTNNRSHFSGNEESFKKAHTSYRELTGKMIFIIESTDISCAYISNSICISDYKMDISMTDQLSQILNSYCEWKNKVVAFISQTDNIFKKNFKDENQATCNMDDSPAHFPLFAVQIL